MVAEWPPYGQELPLLTIHSASRFNVYLVFKLFPLWFRCQKLGSDFTSS